MIYAILMAGGMGTRLKVPVEKPLFKLHDKPLIRYVIDNLKSSRLIDEIVIAVSPHTPETTRYLESLNDDFQILDLSRNPRGFILYKRYFVSDGYRNARNFKNQVFLKFGLGSETGRRAFKGSRRAGDKCGP